MDSFINMVWIPLAASVVSIFYGVTLLMKKDPSIIQNKKIPGKPQDSEKYAVGAGKAMIFLGIVCLGNFALTYVNEYIAFAEVILGFIIFIFYWKKMNDQYGPRK